MYEERNEDVLVNLFVDNGFIIPNDPQKMLLFSKESSIFGRDALINKLIELKKKAKAKENITGFIPVLMDPLAEIEKVVNEDEFSKLSDVAAIDKVNELIKSAKNIGNFRAYDEAQKIMLDQRSFMYESIKALYDLQNNKTDSTHKTHE